MTGVSFWTPCLHLHGGLAQLCSASGPQGLAGHLDTGEELMGIVEHGHSLVCRTSLLPQAKLTKVLRPLPQGNLTCGDLGLIKMEPLKQK